MLRPHTNLCQTLGHQPLLAIRRKWATGEIAGPEVKGHNSFQDAQAFIDAGGYKGLQEQVILAGRYFINPMFATVEIKPMTAVPAVGPR